MIDYNDIIAKYYTAGSELHSLLVVHSRQVTRLALELALRGDLDVDLNFVREAAMLHDIGIVHTHAPGIYCHGSLPYIAHGVEGSRMLTELGLPRHALVCERHTGAGLSLDDIVNQHLPLPHRAMLPVSMEEKLICYADKFFSKTRPDRQKTLEHARRSLEKFGVATLARFDALTALFGSP